MTKTGAVIRPFRIIFGWQVVVTVFLAVIGAWVSGLQGALSAALGGLVAMVGGLVFCLLMPRRTSATAWDALSAMLKAEGAKVGVMVALLWLVMKFFPGLVFIGFIGTFTVAVIIFSMAIFVRNPVNLDSGEPHVS